MKKLTLAFAIAFFSVASHAQRKLVPEKYKYDDSGNILKRYTIRPFDSVEKAVKNPKKTTIYDIDSAEFVYRFGSLDEYHMVSGMSYSHRPDGGGLVPLCGYKIYSFNEPSIYLQNKKYSLDTVKYIKNAWVWFFKENIAINRNAFRLTATVYLNSEDRIKKIIVNGDLPAVSLLFNGYWNYKNGGRPYLEKNGVWKRYFRNDDLTFKRTGVKASLIITSFAPIKP